MKGLIDIVLAGKRKVSSFIASILLILLVSTSMACPVVFELGHHTVISETSTYDNIESSACVKAGRTGGLSRVLSKERVRLYHEVLVEVTSDAAKTSKWVFGSFKSSTKWANQLAKRGWTEKQITEAITKGKKFSAVNNVNKANTATRYVHPTTGQSIVIDDVTKELLHVGGPGFKY